jgi:putative Ca2+/H+ antiporter (TMEM165/GDT1 family)
MININSNGVVDGYDYVTFLRYFIMTITSVFLGYIVSDYSPSVLTQLTKPIAQIIIIYLFLVSSLIRFKNGKKIANKLLVLLFVTLVTVYILQKYKK